jgi:hypothetical protein
MVTLYNKGSFLKIIRLFMEDLKFTFITVSSLNAIVFWIIIVVTSQFYLYVYQNDRNYLSAALIRQFLSAIPSLMNCLLLDHIPKVVESLRQIKLKKKEKVVSPKGGRASGVGADTPANTIGTAAKKGSKHSKYQLPKIASTGSFGLTDFKSSDVMNTEMPSKAKQLATTDDGTTTTGATTVIGNGETIMSHSASGKHF